MAKGWWIDTSNRNLLVTPGALQSTESEYYGTGDDLYQMLVRSPEARDDARRTLYGLPLERRVYVADLIARAEAEARAIYVPPAEHVEQIPSISLRPFPFDGATRRFP